ncbi:MAG: zf-HC2 domain-containing protein [Armatimonadota bacterium]
MKCEEVQPILLDYGRGLVSGPEARRLKAHLDNCKQCSDLLAEELAFWHRLSALPMEEPRNDVWALVRTRTRPRMLRLPAWARGFTGTRAALRRAIAAAAVAVVAAVTVYSFAVLPPDQPGAVQAPPAGVVTVKWSDDPLGGHADALVECMDKM